MDYDFKNSCWSMTDWLSNWVNAYKSQYIQMDERENYSNTDWALKKKRKRKNEPSSATIDW